MISPDYTYPDTGLTQWGRWPAGFRPLRHRIEVGHGRDSFNRLAGAILGWDLHRGAGLTVRAEGDRAVVGSVVVSGFGVGRLRIPAPCAVVWVEDMDDDGGAFRAGFGYGTLKGHPETGEEAFIAELAADGTVYFELRAFSRHANRFYRLGWPVARTCQWIVTRRYLAAARRLASPKDGRRLPAKRG